MPYFKHFVHIINPFILILSAFNFNLGCYLLLVSFEISIVLEWWYRTLILDDLPQFRLDLLNQFLVFWQIILLIKLFDCIFKLAYANRWSSIHISIKRLQFNQVLIDTIKDRFHIHYLQISLEIPIFFLFLTLLFFSLINKISNSLIFNSRVDILFRSWLLLVDYFILLLNFLAILFETLLRED